MDTVVITSFNESLNRLKSIPFQIASVVKERDDFLTKVNSGVDSVKTELTKLKDLINKLKQDKSELETKIASNEKDITGKAQDVQNNNDAIEKCNQKTAALESQLKQKEDQFTNQVTKNQQIIDDKESQMRTLQESNDTQKQKIQQLEALTQNSESASKANTGLMETQKKVLDDQQQKCNDSIKQMQAEIVKNETKIKNLEQSISSKDEQLTNIAKQRTAQANQGQINQSKIQTELTRLQEHSTKLNAEIKQLSDINNDYKNKIVAATTLINQIIEEFNKANTKSDNDGLTMNKFNILSAEIQELSNLLSSKGTYAQALQPSTSQAQGASTTTLVPPSSVNITLTDGGFTMTKTQLIQDLALLVGNNNNSSEKQFSNIKKSIEQLTNPQEIIGMLRRKGTSLNKIQAAAAIKAKNQSKGGNKIKYSKKKQKGGFIYSKKRYNSSSSGKPSSRSSSNYKTRDRRGRGYKKTKKYRSKKK
jgi:chromosome segregation ATPase